MLMVTVTAAAAAITGCANSGPNMDRLEGTWTNAAPSQAPFEMKGMTLASDGTYTAYARIGRSVEGFSGEWTTDGDTLVLQESDRRYEFTRDGERLTVIDPRSDRAQTLERKRSTD
jgi:hypothetical protein